MVNRVALALIFELCAALYVTSARATTTTERLVAACDDKTVKLERVDGKLQKIAESMDSFCEGYLIGSFEALRGEKLVCVKDEMPRPEYLSSVFRMYMEQRRDHKKAAATVVVREAFRRAFPCK